MAGIDEAGGAAAEADKIIGLVVAEEQGLVASGGVVLSLTPAFINAA